MMAPVFENMTPLAKEVALPRLTHALQLEHQRRRELYFGLLNHHVSALSEPKTSERQVIYT